MLSDTSALIRGAWRENAIVDDEMVDNAGDAGIGVGGGFGEGAVRF